jgi:DNA invertase Pin-like site-specific DNA recombinase
MKIGYRRVSSEGQNLDRQDFVCDKMFEEKVSGAKRDREALTAMIEFAREGDEVIVWSIDRLARDLRDLQDIIQRLNDKGISVAFLKEKLVFSGDADDAFARLQLQMMGAFAEFERNIIRKRQAEGIAVAKAKGVYKGGKKRIDRDKVHQLKAEGLSTYKIADAMGVSRMSVHRILNTESA